MGERQTEDLWDPSSNPGRSQPHYQRFLTHKYLRENSSVYHLTFYSVTLGLTLQALIVAICSFICSFTQEFSQYSILYLFLEAFRSSESLPRYEDALNLHPIVFLVVFVYYICPSCHCG